MSANPPTLHHEAVTGQGGAPRAWVLFLHGIYGAGRNWGSVARRMVSERPELGVLLVDLRQHGSSQGFPPPHTLAAAAADVAQLVEAQGLAGASVLGHSFGGKVALVYARSADPPPAQLWVVDSTPEAGPPRGSAWEMLEALRALPSYFESREEALSRLEAEGVARPVAQWMGTNLVRGDGGLLGWRIDLADMEALLRDFFHTDAWDVVESPPAGTDLHVVKAAASSVLGEAACARIERAGERSGRVQLHRVGGGHWVNADNPEALITLLVEKLPG